MPRHLLSVFLLTNAVINVITILYKKPDKRITHNNNGYGPNSLDKNSSYQYNVMHIHATN